MIGVLIVGFLTFFLIWPMPWFHLDYVFSYTAALRNYPHSVPEVFFGKLMLVPVIYYAIYFLITTPLLILIFFIAGLVKINRQKTWILLSLVAWFIIPFIQSFYNFRQHGVRYIIEIYAPLALISAIGIEFIVDKLKKKWFKTLFVIGVISYLFFILLRITPYYLDYFNELVGGPKNVYEKRMFQLGWWGQGIREAAYYIKNHAPLGSRIGIALSPSHVTPPLEKMVVERYEEGKKYDYIIVNFYNVLREGFDDSKIKDNYRIVYEVNADGAKLVSVYKHYD